MNSRSKFSFSAMGNPLGINIGLKEEIQKSLQKFAKPQVREEVFIKPNTYNLQSDQKLFKKFYKFLNSQPKESSSQKQSSYPQKKRPFCPSQKPIRIQKTKPSTNTSHQNVQNQTIYISKRSKSHRKDQLLQDFQKKQHKLINKNQIENNLQSQKAQDMNKQTQQASQYAQQLKDPNDLSVLKKFKLYQLKRSLLIKSNSNNRMLKKYKNIDVKNKTQFQNSIRTENDIVKQDHGYYQSNDRYIKAQKVSRKRSHGPFLSTDSKKYFNRDNFSEQGSPSKSNSSVKKKQTIKYMITQHKLPIYKEVLTQNSKKQKINLAHNSILLRSERNINLLSSLAKKVCQKPSNKIFIEQKETQNKKFDIQVPFQLQINKLKLQQKQSLRLSKSQNKHSKEKTLFGKFPIKKSSGPKFGKKRRYQFFGDLEPWQVARIEKDFDAQMISSGCFEFKNQNENDDKAQYVEKNFFLCNSSRTIY